MPLPPSFTSKKAKILSQLSIPDAEYDDLSPKGSVDIGIRELIDEINEREGWVTTSSCAGRMSVYLDGEKVRVRDAIEGEEGVEERKAGGKGGGKWLFVSHDPVDVEGLNVETGYLELFGLGLSHSSAGDALSSTVSKSARLIHFKFEPMILHVLTASSIHAQSILSAALQAGFRESGALNITPSTTSEAVTPMVGIRSMGLGLESIIGVERDGELHVLVPEWQLRWLVDIANERFVENEKRIARFRELLKTSEKGSIKKQGAEGKDWEDKDVRRERMRKEGQAKAEELRRQKGNPESKTLDSTELGEPDISGLEI